MHRHRLSNESHNNLYKGDEYEEVIEPIDSTDVIGTDLSRRSHRDSGECR